MRHCAFCGSALPDKAHFCGRCGQASESELSLLGTQAKRGQAPMANVSMMQGTPQANGVPKIRVQGTSQANGVPKVQGKGTPSTPAGKRAAESPPPPRRLYSLDDHDLHDLSPLPSYSPIPHFHWYRQRRPKISATRWLTIIFTSLVIIAGIISGLSFLSSPTMWLSGSKVVVQGDTLQLHGAGFFSGSSVTFMLDGHLPLSLIDRGTSPVEPRYPPSSQTVQINLSGTFNVAIVVSQVWSLGAHTIRATESLSARSAEVSFTIVAKPAKLAVTPLSLDFGLLQKGNQETQTLMISNVGQQPLHWMANVGTANWLVLDTYAGTLQPGTFQMILVTADTTRLSEGNYLGTLTISTNSERMQVTVALLVVALPTPTPTPTQASPPPPSTQAPPPPPRPKPRPKPTPTPTPLPTPTPMKQGDGGRGG